MEAATECFTSSSHEGVSTGWPGLSLILKAALASELTAQHRATRRSAARLEMSWEGSQPNRGRKGEACLSTCGADYLHSHLCPRACSLCPQHFPPTAAPPAACRTCPLTSHHSQSASARHRSLSLYSTAAEENAAEGCQEKRKSGPRWAGKHSPHRRLLNLAAALLPSECIRHACHSRHHNYPEPQKCYLPPADSCSVYSSNKIHKESICTLHHPLLPQGQPKSQRQRQSLTLPSTLQSAGQPGSFPPNEKRVPLTQGLGLI